MVKSGLYGKYQGTEYEITVDMENNIKIMTIDKEKINDTFVDTYNSGVYTKIVQANELTDCVNIRSYGVIDGERIRVLQERENKYQVGTGFFEIGTILNLPRVDRDTWLGWVPKQKVKLIVDKTPINPSDL